jgi:membrane dipeptidase
LTLHDSVPLPVDRIEGFNVRHRVLERIRKGHQAFLDEVRPSRQQLEHGLELHYDSFVGDVQGTLSTTYIAGLIGDRLEKDIGTIQKKFAELEEESIEARRKSNEEIYRWKIFESASDPQWIEESRALLQLAGVQLGTIDVAGPEENSFDKALHRLARNSFVHEHRDDLIRVTKAADIERGQREGQHCVIFHLAGVGCFAEAEDPLRNLDLFHALGVRMSQLTYIQKNALCCSWFQDQDSGLTPLGKQAVQRMNELGMMVDLAHTGDQSSADIIAASDEPVMFSHTGCRAIYDDSGDTGYIDAVMRQPYSRGTQRPAKLNPRNASDEQITAVGRQGGLVAFYTIAYMLGTGPESFDVWYRHLEHAIELAGIDHVAIGQDRTYIPSWEPGPLDWTNWPLVTVGLVCKGLSDEEIRKVIGANYKRHAMTILDKQPWGPFV